MKNNPPTRKTLRDSTTASNQSAMQPLKLDPDEYRKDLAGFDLTEEQQNELLQTLWNIMSTFVDIGWGVDTVQMFLPDIFSEVAPDSEKLLESKDTQKLNQTATAEKGQQHD